MWGHQAILAVLLLGFPVQGGAHNVKVGSAGECNQPKDNVAIPSSTPGSSDHAAGEMLTRRHLAAGYRLLERHGHGDLAAGFFTCRSPENHSVMLVGQQGLHFGEVRASDIVAVDIYTKQVLSSSDRPVSFGALQLATAVYRRHPEVGAFLHSHPQDAMALAALVEPELLMLAEPSFLFYERVAYADADYFFGDAYAATLASNLDGGKFVVLVKNHAIMVAGKDVPQTFYRAYAFNQAAGVQLRAMAATGGRKEGLHETPRNESLYHRRSCEEWAGGFDGSLEWPGLLRGLERDNADYKE